MKRVKLLLGMLVLATALAAAVVFGSPYAPVVGPAPENIEEIWDIEDARQESAAPLVTALENNGVPLAYDAAANMFYCTIGLGNGDEWPLIHLTAPEAKGVALRFVDDYTYDWCTDATSEGYSYQIIAYTDTEFAYCDVVFTGLPQLCLYTDGTEVTTEDSPVRVTMAVYSETPLESTGRIHLRGASTLLFEKKSYKLEFTREHGGEVRKISMNAPGFGETEELALLPCWHDETKMRDRLNWDMWSELTRDDEPFGARRTAYAEVFVDNEYAGVYLLVEPVDVQAEIALAGSDRLETDSLYRTAALNFSRDREYYTHPHRANAGYELYYAPASADTFDKRFAALMPYIELTEMEDDEAFAARAAELFDLEGMLRYALLMQGGAIADNFFNNMYIWAHPLKDGSVQYRFAPWDLDMSWGFESDEIGENFERWLYFPVLDRMLSLDAGGIRQKALDVWRELRGSVLSMEYLEAKIGQYTAELGESGALMRDAERWGNYMTYPDGYELVTFADMRWPLLDEAMEMIAASEGPVAFLTASNYEQKAGAIHADEEAEYADFYAAVQEEAGYYAGEDEEPDGD